MRIRPETPVDYQAIHDLTQAAFAPMAFADGDEGDVINQMRDDGDLTLSLVAETDQIIGHVALSPAQISDAQGTWYGLGPISVRADHQRQGIGTQLAKAGLAHLTGIGAAGCVLIGNPVVYGPMGFISDGGLTHGGLDPKLVQYITLNGARPKGEVLFAPALQVDFP